MADDTGIQWTDATWNPTRGCTLVSAGCQNCYAMTVAHRFNGPCHSMSDIHHENIPLDYVAAVYGAMAASPQHQFQVPSARS